MLFRKKNIAKEHVMGNQYAHARKYNIHYNLEITMSKGLKAYLVISSLMIVLLVSYIVHIHLKYTLFIDQNQKDLIGQFNEVAIGAEHGGVDAIVKWDGPIKLFVETDSTYEDQLNFMQVTLEDINCIQPQYLKIERADVRADANAILTMCSYDKLQALAPTFSSLVTKNECGWVNFSYKNYKIYKSKIFINTSFSLDKQKNAIVEELVQSLGLAKDILTDKKSLFYQNKNIEHLIYQKITDRDRQIIQLLYNPKILPGQNRYQTEKAILAILN
jgi:hypothetical protein